MGVYKTKINCGKTIEITIDNKHDLTIKNEFILSFCENDIKLLPYHSFIRFLKYKGIKYLNTIKNE